MKKLVSLILLCALVFPAVAPVACLAFGGPPATRACSTGKRACAINKSCMIRHADGTVECTMRKHKNGAHGCTASYNCARHDDPVLPVVQNVERPFIVTRLSLFTPGALRVYAREPRDRYESLVPCPPHRPPTSL